LPKKRAGGRKGWPPGGNRKQRKACLILSLPVLNIEYRTRNRRMSKASFDIGYSKFDILGYKQAGISGKVVGRQAFATAGGYQ
jgi:hypothetical protein